MNTLKLNEELILEKRNYYSKKMGSEIDHEEIARELAKAMAVNANEKELRRLYEETMFQQFMSMEKKELSELLWHG